MAGSPPRMPTYTVLDTALLSQVRGWDGLWRVLLAVHTNPSQITYMYAKHDVYTGASGAQAPITGIFESSLTLPFVHPSKA